VVYPYYQSFKDKPGKIVEHLTRQAVHPIPKNYCVVLKCVVLKLHNLKLHKNHSKKTGTAQAPPYRGK